MSIKCTITLKVLAFLFKQLHKNFDVIKKVIQKERFWHYITLLSFIGLIFTSSGFCYNYSTIKKNKIIFEQNIEEMHNKFDDGVARRINSIKYKLTPLMKRIHDKCRINSSLATIIFHTNGNEFEADLIDTVWLGSNNTLLSCNDDKVCKNEGPKTMNATLCRNVIEGLADIKGGCNRIEVSEFYRCNDLLDKLKALGETSQLVYACVYPTKTKKTYYAVGFFGVDSNTRCGNNRLQEYANDIFTILKQA